MPDQIKKAFSKVKQEIDYVLFELESLKNSLDLLKIQVSNNQTNQPTLQHSKLLSIEENQHKIQHINTSQQTDTATPTNTPTYIPTQNLDFKSLKPQISDVSTGNEGVPTNQPTNQQTNQHPLVSHGNLSKTPQNREFSSFNQSNQPFNNRIDHLEKVSEILLSLDELKKEVRIKFKKLTEQEMLVYSTIYQLEDKGLSVDYSLLAQHLNLTEISIRDYIRKVINKGIPLDKLKENNKKILLSIPKDLKKVASLNTILQLRDI